MRFLMILSLLALAFAGCAGPDPDASDGHAMDGDMAGHNHTEGMDHSMMMGAASTQPMEGGQDAFAAIQEIVALLEADPATDWTRVNITALREHLVDMERVSIGATVEHADVPGGFSAKVMGSDDRTREAIGRMVPAHSGMVDGLHGWDVSWTPLADGMVVRVTSSDAAEATHLRALGFFGFLTTDGHHQAHHLALAIGDDPHASD